MMNQEELLRKLVTTVTTEHRAISHQIITFNSDSVFTLTVPDQARYALMLLEEAGGTGTVKLLRYWEDGSIPTSTEGLVRGDMDAWDVLSYSNLKDFKAIRLTANSHKLFVQYYS